MLGAQTYEEDAKKARFDYAEHKTETTRQHYYALGPKMDMLIIATRGGWDTDSTDKLMEDHSYAWRRMGFRRVGFVYFSSDKTVPWVDVIRNDGVKLRYRIYREEAL
jgi:hypothetical protein